MDRRSLLKGAVLLSTAGSLGLGRTAAAGPVLPDYRYLRDALVPPLAYDPTGELIFPCVVNVEGRARTARGRYYLYYAPHEKPGGICVAFADSLAGPFTEYPGNPIVDNQLPDGKVSHVSSPHVVWDAPTRQFYLYFHGENRTTRVARSADGLDFHDEKPILESTFVPGLIETSYARVFEHALPGRDNRYTMLYMGTGKNIRRIYHGWSPDGWDRWQFSPVPLVNPGPDRVSGISGPTLLLRDGTAYVAYHGNDGAMRLAEVGPAFDRERHLGVFYRPAPEDRGRAASPWFCSERGIDYMFYESGPRLSARICIARAG